MGTAPVLCALLLTWSAAAAPQPSGAGKSQAQQGAPKATPSAPDQKPKPAEDEEKDKVIVENADRLRYDGDRKVYVLEGNVRMKHKDVVLTCDYAEYWEERDEAQARGHLLLRDPESSITGDTIRVDFTDEIAVVEGNVVIVTQKQKKAEGESTGSSTVEGNKGQGDTRAAAGGAGEQAGQDSSASKQEQPKSQPSGGESGQEDRPKSIREARERKTTIYCPRVRYRYTEGQRYAWISGPIRAEQKGRQAWADQAEYDDEEGVLKLVGNVRVKTDEGDEFTCPAAVVSVEEEWLRAEKISGIAIRKKKKTEQTSQPATATEQTVPPSETEEHPPPTSPAKVDQPPPAPPR
ncbi:MAG: hypothetical protein N2512_11960 [Armatimonadetes bacterium]|nr:hypothetical protein [Armatimonadota bacterium]